MTEAGPAIFLLGLLIGSFLSVCIHRLPRGESVVTPRSACPHCGRTVLWRDNLPLVGYLLLWGRCRHCRGSISPIYPVVELLTAVLFLLLYLKYGFSSAFLLNAVLFGLLVVLVFIDLFERILPNRITFPGMALGVLASPFQSPEFFESDPFLGTPGSVFGIYVHSLLGLVLGGGILWVVAWLYRKIRKVEGLGFGDVKMMAMVGAFLGWRYAWMTIFIGSLSGSILGSLYIFLLGKGRRYELPFGTFLGLGAVLVALWGASLLDWYSARL